MPEESLTSYSRNYPRKSAESISEMLTDEVKKMILSKVGEHKFNTLINAKNTDEEWGITIDERIEIIILAALKYPGRQILTYLNMKRIKNGLKPIPDSTYAYVRQRYFALIDDTYATIAKNISDIFPFTDKIHRLIKLNELATMFSYYLSNVEEITRDTLAIVNTYLKILDKIDHELGSVPLSDRVNYIAEHAEKQIESKIKSKISSQVEGKIPNYIKGILKERYKEQLPVNLETDDENKSYEATENNRQSDIE